MKYISYTIHSGTASSALPGSHPWRATPRQSQVMVSNWTTGGLGWWNRCSYEEAVGYLRCHQDQLCELQVDGSPHMSKNAQIIEVHGGHDSDLLTCGFFRLTWPSPGNDFLAASLKRWDSLDYFMVSFGVFLSLPRRWLFRTRRICFLEVLAEHQNQWATWRIGFLEEILNKTSRIWHSQLRASAPQKRFWRLQGGNPNGVQALRSVLRPCWTLHGCEQVPPCYFSRSLQAGSNWSNWKMTRMTRILEKLASPVASTSPPKLPSRGDILPALPPPPPRPVAVEVKPSEKGTGGTGLRGVLEKQVKEHGQSIWKGAQSATDEIRSAPAFSAKQTSEVRKVPSPQQEPAQAFHAQEKLEPDEAGDNEKDTWSWWKGRWWDWDSQEKRYIEVEQRDKADSDMELDLVSGKEDDPIGQWANLLRKGEDEKTEKLKELASSETSCREVDDEDNGQVRKAARPSISRQTSDDMESIMEEEEDEHEELIKRTREVLQHHRGEAPVQRSGKRGRNPISTTQKIKTERQSILEACKGKICKTGWQARALQGGGPGVTLLPVVLQGDLPVWGDQYRS